MGDHGFFLDHMKKEDHKKAFAEYAKDWCFSFAPGRIEFLGNHLDYNGGDVLGMAVNAGIYCLGVPQPQNQISFFSESFEDSGWSGEIDKIERQSGKFSWNNYTLGVLKELHSLNLTPKKAFRLIFTSNLPTSVGLSSSAALELASALTILQLAGKSLPKKELANLCRLAENEFVGLPCGILDQGTSAFGKKDHLVHIDCDKEVFDNIPIPAESEIWIFNTGIKHDLVDSLYSTRHQECMDALKEGRKRFPDKDKLTSFSLDEINELNLPENLRKRATHVSQEQLRVQSFRTGLASNASPEELGKLLAESHASSSQNFENSCRELDFLAEHLNQHDSVLGARLTGGGFGGAVMAWTQSNFNKKDAKEIVSLYHQEFGQEIDHHNFLPSDGASKEDILKVKQDSIK